MRGALVISIVLGLVTGAPCADQLLAVRYAALSPRPASSTRPASVLYRLDVEFTEEHLGLLLDDEADVSLTVRARDARGARHQLDDLEDCRFQDDASLRCPQGLVFERIGDRPVRWRLAFVFSQPGSGGARGPVTVELAYSVSGGPRTVHTGVIRDCKPARGGPTIVCERRETGVSP